MALDLGCHPADGDARRLDADRAHDRARRQRLPGGHERAPTPTIRSASKELLAEAGYADGFPVTLDCPNDRYVNDEAICTAVVPMLAADRHRRHPERADQVACISPRSVRRRQQHQLLHARLDARHLDAHNALQNIMTLDGDAQGTWNSGALLEPQGRGADRPDRGRDRRGQAQRADPRGLPDPQGRRRPPAAAPAGAGLGHPRRYGRERDPAAVQRRRPAHRGHEVGRIERGGPAGPPRHAAPKGRAHDRLHRPAAAPGGAGHAGGRADRVRAVQLRRRPDQQHGRAGHHARRARGAAREPRARTTRCRAVRQLARQRACRAISASPTAWASPVARAHRERLPATLELVFVAAVAGAG